LIVLDASVLIAHLYQEDAHHAAAKKIFQDNVDEDFVAHSITLAEVMVGPARIGQVQVALEAFDALRVEEFIAEPGEAVRLAHLRVSTSLKIPDCCSLGAAIDEDATLATFDRRLATAARGLGTKVLPPV
jgi:predicted nucleic acid-binding protein